MPLNVFLNWGLPKSKTPNYIQVLSPVKLETVNKLEKIGLNQGCTRLVSVGNLATAAPSRAKILQPHPSPSERDTMPKYLGHKGTNILLAPSTPEKT